MNIAFSHTASSLTVGVFLWIVLIHTLKPTFFCTWDAMNPSLSSFWMINLRRIGSISFWGRRFCLISSIVGGIYMLYRVLDLLTLFAITRCPRPSLRAKITALSSFDNPSSSSHLSAWHKFKFLEMGCFTLFTYSQIVRSIHNSMGHKYSYVALNCNAQHD